MSNDCQRCGELEFEIETTQQAFAMAVKAMIEYMGHRPRGGDYISREEAEPYLTALPEFWHEPARVMACCGYYASADGWMAKHVEAEPDQWQAEVATKLGFEL